jgi:hypothetical protein
MVLAIYQYDKAGWVSQQVITFQKVPANVISIPADIFACFRVRSDTHRIVLQLYRDNWNPIGQGVLCTMDAPYCQTDFFRHYSGQPVMYVLVTFIGERMILDFLHGVHPQLHKKPGDLVIKGGKPCQIFRRKDMPDEAKDLCNFAPLDTIDIW